MNLRARRKAVNFIALSLSLGAMAFGLFWLVWILWMVVDLGIGALSLRLFTGTTFPTTTTGRSDLIQITGVWGWPVAKRVHRARKPLLSTAT